MVSQYPELNPMLLVVALINKKSMKNQEQKGKENIEDAIKDVHANEHQDLGKENIGNEPEEQGEGDPDSPYKLKHTLDDKRPEDSSIKKGWTVDSNTSRGFEDQKDTESE